MPMLLNEAEGNTEHDITRQSYPDPARSKTLCTPGSFFQESREISSAPEPAASGGTGKVKSRHPVVYADEKSDAPVVPKKPSNKKDVPAEVVEERGVAKRNAHKDLASRTVTRSTSRSPMATSSTPSYCG